MFNQITLIGKPTQSAEFYITYPGAILPNATTNIFNLDTYKITIKV